MFSTALAKRLYFCQFHSLVRYQKVTAVQIHVRCKHQGKFERRSWTNHLTIDDQEAYNQLLEDEGVPSVKDKLKHVFGVFRSDSIYAIDSLKDIRRLDHGDFRIEWTFATLKDIAAWKVTTDKMCEMGTSEAELVLTAQQTALFHGNLCTKIPKGVDIDHTGFVSMIARPYKVYNCVQKLHWTPNLGHSDKSNWQYNNIFIRCRGDGRAYHVFLNKMLENRFATGSIRDTWSMKMYTRGGPYWETIVLPLSKFVYSHKGRIQDQPYRFPINQAKTLGITLADYYDGPFRLEIDCIGLSYDASLWEDLEFELYQINPDDTY